MNIKQLFTEHPSSLNETYIQHMGQAMCISYRAFKISMTAFVHALFPFMFVRTTGDNITDLHELVQTRRSKGDSYIL